MVVILIVLPYAPPPPSTAPSQQPSAFHHAEQRSTKPEFEPIRTHRIISAATAAAARSPYRRSDDSAVSYARLRYIPWTPSASPIVPTTDRNNNNTKTTSSAASQQQRWKRTLPERQSLKRKQWKRAAVPTTTTTNTKSSNFGVTDSSSSNRHRLTNNNSSNNRVDNDDNSRSNNLRYTSRVIISDDFSQVDIKSDDNEVEAISREEEIIKKRKTELITTRQIETRVQRQLKFEDGKVIEDSGPIVSTNTTEDTDRQETVQTEHRTLGDPTTEEEVTKNAAVVDSDGKPVPIGVDASDGGGSQNLVSDTKGGGGLAGDSTSISSSSNKPKTISAIVARPDGLLKNIKEEVEVSREETKERTVHEERKHFGDFTDDSSSTDSFRKSNRTFSPKKKLEKMAYLDLPQGTSTYAHKHQASAILRAQSPIDPTSDEGKKHYDDDDRKRSASTLGSNAQMSTGEGLSQFSRLEFQFYR
ncbi:hypothetical protein RP20_CCG002683 [Aedes albopictus]|nr:hypothetical protein RP20_CCG002683 [Aedes albopictus]